MYRSASHKGDALLIAPAIHCGFLSPSNPPLTAGLLHSIELIPQPPSLGKRRGLPGNKPSVFFRFFSPLLAREGPGVNSVATLVSVSGRMQQPCPLRDGRMLLKKLPHGVA